MRKTLVIFYASLILLLIFVLSGCAAATETTVPSPSPLPTAPGPTPTPMIEERTIEVEWPGALKLGDSDLVRLALFPSTGGYSAQLEYPEHTLELGEVEVPYLPGYQAQAIARMDAAGMEFEPRGDQVQTLQQGTPVSWRWTISPQSAGRHRINLQIMLRWIPLADEGQATEVVLWRDTLEIHVQAPLGLSAPQARILGVAGMLIGGILVLPLAELTARQRLERARGKRIRLLRPNPELVLETSLEVELNDVEALILKGLFKQYARVMVESRYDSGYSAARTLLVHPIRPDGRADAYAIVKIGPRGIIQSEYGNYEAFVRHTLPPITSRVLGPPAMVPRIQEAALEYTFVGTPSSAPMSLRNYAKIHPAEMVASLIEERLFSIFGPSWWMQRQPYLFRLSQEYERLLPVHLLLEPTSASRGARLLSGESLQIQGVKAGEPVRLEGAKVLEVRPQRHTLTFSWPDSQTGSNIRIRFQEVKSGRFEEGRSASGIHGQVIATQMDLLQAEVAKALPALELNGDSIFLADRWLPNPLLRLSELLGQRIQGTRSVIHGDLNLENVLVGPGDLVWLIDFAATREGHTLFDFARLEVELTTQVIADRFTEWGMGLQDFLKLFKYLETGVAAQEEKIKECQTLLEAVRRVANRCLYDPADSGEFRKALILSYLGCLKFSNLDEAPSAPLPKAFAFAAAAYLTSIDT